MFNGSKLTLIKLFILALLVFELTSRWSYSRYRAKLGQRKQTNLFLLPLSNSTHSLILHLFQWWIGFGRLASLDEQVS